MFHGSIGMTYEQASVRGLVVRRDDDSVMHYRDSVQHHFIASLATAETAARNRRDVLQAFLQVFDEGRMTDGRGRTVDFDHAVLVLTSNLGSEALRQAANERRVGFGRKHDPTSDTERMKKVALDAARAALPPELYNRLDEVMFFRHLSRDDVRAVAARLLEDLRKRLSARDVRLEVEDAAIDALLELGGYDVELGARPMRRAIVRHIEAPLADMILRGELEDGAVALVGADDGELVVDAVTRRRGRRAG